MISESLTQHPRFVLMVELGALLVAPLEELWDQPVLFKKHQWVACKLEPATDRLLGYPLIPMH